ncbi:MAG TPA: Cys-tRNA(Pro) deacylase [Devosia sp.]|jgi:Cys-tRNA(Pro)/Cys-tRNA(Cys) deacylase|nr:Cys-tRNA(Pro) deacylase [Devosia sp.]
MSHTTQGTLLLDSLGIAYELHPYAYDPEAPRVGLQAAEALGLEPGQTFKTLMLEVDGKPVCAVVPSDREASLKKVAGVFAGKSAQMMKVPAAERLTGYKVGGIGPFGQKRKVPTAFDETIELYDRIYINAGQRGLLLSIAPADAVRVAEGKVADLCG